MPAARPLSLSERLVRGLYTGLYLPASPFVLAYWATRPDCWSRLGELTGRVPDGIPRGGDPPHPIWVHAVSAGETAAAIPILQQLRDAGHSFFLTTTIQDALTTAERFDLELQGAAFLPLDVPGFHARLLEHLQPSACLISETDLWPNMLLELGARGVPTYLVNGRVSAKLARGWGAARPLLGAAALSALRGAFVQTEADAGRLADMGLPRNRAHVVGNTKYDMAPPAPLPEEYAGLHAAMAGDERPLVVAGSTHAPEEAALLEALGGAPGAPPRLVLVPRNPARAAEVMGLAQQGGRRAGLWSELARMRASIEAYDVVVVDVMGQLAALYEGATVAYVGGGFGTTGGHNFLEAAFQALPILGGPNFRNFAADVEAFAAAGAFRQCADPGEVQEALWELLEDPADAQDRGQRGRALLEKGRSAAAGTAAAILEDLAACPAPAVRADQLT